MELGMGLMQSKNKRNYGSMYMHCLCRQRLMEYAGSFEDLSKGFSDFKSVQSKGRGDILIEHSLNENKKIVSDNLSIIAKIMEKFAEEITEFEPVEERKRRRLVNALADEGIGVTDIYYIPDKGNHYTIGICMHSNRKMGVFAKDVADMLSVLLKRQLRLSVSSPAVVEREEKIFIFVEETPFVVITGFSKATKDGELISGDNYSILESEHGKVELILSDGTGSGDSACDGSEKVLDLLEKMLDTGYDADTAIHMINSCFYAMGNESDHPTLDLCELDLHSGECELRKVGAAPSFLKRGEYVEQIGGESLPLGMLNKEDVVSENVLLRDGDFIIMMSDGVLDALNEHEYEETMKRLISVTAEQNPGELAERLLQTVLCLGGGRIRDDMTILVAGIWKNNRLDF